MQAHGNFFVFYHRQTLLEKFALCAADAENLKIALFEAEVWFDY